MKAAPVDVPLAPDWRPRAREIAAVETRTKMRLVRGSQIATRGLVRRAASALTRWGEATLAQPASSGRSFVVAGSGGDAAEPVVATGTKERGGRGVERG